MREAALSGRWSYARARRRCNINVPLACSTTHLFGCGTKPLAWSAGLRRTTSTVMSSIAPWMTTSSLNPWSTHPVRSPE
jgi:hypothetical protein